MKTRLWHKTWLKHKIFPEIPLNSKIFKKWIFMKWQSHPQSKTFLLELFPENVLMYRSKILLCVCEPLSRGQRCPAKWLVGPVLIHKPVSLSCSACGNKTTNAPPHPWLERVSLCFPWCQKVKRQRSHAASHQSCGSRCILTGSRNSWDF